MNLSDAESRLRSTIVNVATQSYSQMNIKFLVVMQGHMTGDSRGLDDELD